MKPYATVALQQVTQVSFAIDKTSTFNFSTVSDTCNIVPSTNFTLSGTKLIGAPNILKYSASQTTNGSGVKTISGLEWDTYSATLNSGSYVLKGTIPLLPLALAPNSTQNVALVLAPVNARQLLVSVKDGATGLPLTDADVELSIGAYDQTLTTDRGYIVQSDWSGGDLQATSSDPTKFYTSDGNIDYSGFPGDIRLKQIFGTYQSSGSLTSSIYDLGSASNFYQILWNPGSEPAETGTDSVKFQIATGNDPATSTWNYLGPDGTSATFYTSVNQNIASVHDGDRYARYKLFMSTASTTFTPTISDVSLTFTASCVPPGQVLFSAIPQTGTASLTVNRSGYQPYTTTINIGSAYQSLLVNMTP